MWIVHFLHRRLRPRPVRLPESRRRRQLGDQDDDELGHDERHLEPFNWRGIGWLPGRATGFITSPVKANLKFEAIPWSPSTNGTVSGQVVIACRARVAHRGGADGLSRDDGPEGERRHRVVWARRRTRR
jgi:hypothetical protein